MSTASSSGTTALVPRLGLWSATSIVVGSMIGSGIFIVSADIARLVDSPMLLLTVWVVTGLLTIMGALCYSELSAMMPEAGGQYVYLRESLGPLWGFLYGWTMFMVIQTGTIAALGMAFGKFLGHFVPSVSSTNWLWHIGHIPEVHIGPVALGNMDIGLSTLGLVAIVVICLLTAVNVYGVGLGAAVQNVFTFAKTAALIGLIVAGAIVGANHVAVQANFTEFWQTLPSASHVAQVLQTSVADMGALSWVSLALLVAVAQVGSLFSADAWNNVTFIAGEVKNPKRNLPLSLVLGTGSVILLYILANVIFLSVLPLDGTPNGATVLDRGIKYALEDRVGTAVMQQILGGSGAAVMSLAVLISTFGCCNGMILAGGRIYYAMAKDKLFFDAAARIHPKHKTPAAALVMQMVWSALLCISGSYGQLLDYIMFAVLLFYILTIGGLFVLRRTRPQATRPYKALGYPWMPAIYIAALVAIDLVLLRYKPQFTWPGLAIVLLGIPVYLARVSLNRRRAAQVL